MIKDIVSLFRIFHKARPRYSIIVGVILVTLTCSAVGLDLAFNSWRSIFWSAVEAKNIAVVVHQVWVFAGLAFTSIGLYTVVSYLGQRYSLEWRQELCRSLLDRWILKGDTGVESPDQRIQEDTAKFVSLFNGLFLGLVTAILTLVMFIPLLSSIGSHLIPLFGISGGWWLPTVCVALSGLGFGITSWLGRAIPTLENQNQRTEADFRYELVHVRDGKREQLPRMGDIWKNLYDNHVRLFKKSRNFNLGSNCFFQSMVIIPILCILPSYFGGLVAFGIIMSVLDAFGKVANSLNWYLDNFLAIASFKATLIRIVSLDRSLNN